jgi:histidinol dehydrogenase
MARMLTELTPQDPAFAAVTARSQDRLQQLVREAEVRARPYYERVLGRPASIAEVIAEIFAAVEREGDEALVRYSQLFDRSPLAADALLVPAGACAAAWQATAPALQAAMRVAIERIEAYQRRLLPQGFATGPDQPLGVRWLPLERVGAYVPGGAQGATPLFSSVLMNLVPARVAGVRDLVLVTPPRPDGSVADEILAAAHAVGVREVYRLGGIPAIAALACGTPRIAAVDKIVGPGNIFVTLAKQYAFGRVDIDMLAGPSEVLVIADGSVDARLVAADLLSEAEHDPLAMCICLTIGAPTPAPIQAALRQQLAALPEARRAVAAQSLERFGTLVRCADRAEAVRIANRIAPEHLEVLTERPHELVSGLVHAGAIFIGPWSPEPIGDYVAGPSHTLPTGGSARIWSGIGADTFLRRTSLIHFSEADFRACMASGIAMARQEGMEAHARAIEIRTAPAAADIPAPRTHGPAAQ